jgi:exonuclease SbcC
MSDSHPDLVAAKERLQTQLRESFVDRGARVSSIDWAPYPLLLLESKRELAAFAVSNGDQPEAFRSSYGFFRTMYGERHRTWDDLHLSFVFCVGHRSRDLESLYTGIETDVFFCRKYTVALDEPLESELARLPFVPLQRPAGATLRPASAQAVMKGLGAPAKLAAALAGRVGEDTIVQNCLDGDYDLPTPIDSPRPDLRGAENVGSSVRLKALEIEDFRAYRKKCRFDVDADLVLLYGPNGFGKTSFFDALDFAATGDIGRLRLDRNESRFTKAASHLDADHEAGVVSLTFSQEGTDVALRRTVADRRRASLGDRIVDRKDALLALTAATPVSGADHVEHLVRLFRASHIFSQDFQALTDELREHSRLSTEVVSRMLTFEEYVAARRKIARVLEALEQRSTTRGERVATLEEQKAKLLDERRRLKQHGETAKAPLLVDSLRERIRETLQTIGISSVREKDLAAEALGWRAALDAGLSDANARRTALEKVRNEAATIGDIRNRIESDQKIREQQKVVASELAELLRASEVELRQLEAETETVSAETQRLEKQLDNQKWVRAALQQRSSLFNRQSELERQISETVQKLSDDSATLAGMAKTVSDKELELQRNDTEVAVVRQRLADLTRVRDQWTEWVQRSSVRAQRVKALTDALLAVDTAGRQESESAEAFSLAQKEEESAAAEVKAFETAQTDLQNLLARLEAYVVDSKCPACGADHESSDLVLSRLRDHRRTTAMSAQANERLAQLSQRLAMTRADFSNFQTASREAKVRVDSLQAEIGDIDRRDAAFAADAARIGVPLPQLGDTLRGAIDEATQRELLLVQTSLELREEVNRVRDERTSLASAVQSLSDQLAKIRQAADGLVSEIDKIRAEARARESDLEIAPSVLEELDTRAIEGQQKLLETLTAKRTERDAAAKRVAESSRNVQSHQKASQATEKAIRTGHERLGTHERDLELLLGKGRTHAALSEALEENVGRIQQLESMKQEIISFEIAVDSAATAAAAARIRVGLKEIDSDAERVTAENAKEQKWAEQFRRIEVGLAKTQEDAVAGYTNIYGPLTSTIQRRLRAVSGFGDIVLKPERSSIEVNVLRNGEQLPPTDYFSQSQQQILMLSLFLTACVTQTWSSFAPILLDDPISNFDDLNGYALLDLIGGLVEEEPGRRQFVFALCDERMFKLARQRFRHLSGGLRVFSFQSFGADGPTVVAS